MKIRDKLNNNNKTVGELHICEDCDQPIDESAATKRYIDFFLLLIKVQDKIFAEFYF